LAGEDVDGRGPPTAVVSAGEEVSEFVAEFLTTARLSLLGEAGGGFLLLANQASLLLFSLAFFFSLTWRG
jgi:hypothetical protein